MCPVLWGTWPTFGNKKQILNTVEQAYNNAEEKLSKYMSEGQPGIHFPQDVSVFDPCHIAFMNNSVDSYNSIPDFSSVPDDKFNACFSHLDPAALRALVSGVVDLDVFWNGPRRDFHC